MNNCYEVIIVGGDHHNGLGLARIFGFNHITVHSVVICENPNIFLGTSKFIRDCRVFPNEKEAFDSIIKEYGEERKKYFIIPYSDSAAIELDLRLNEFEGFMVPSINGEQGRIAQLMNKSNQYEFAKKNGIRMAETSTFFFDRNRMSDLSSMKFPCIVKPVISAEGEKRDIAICKSFGELQGHLNNLKKKQYSRVLIQEYLTIDYEIDVFGCTLKQSPYICQIPTKTIRSWPVEGGTNSFSQIITNEEILKKCKGIIDYLRNDGFYGLYDIELFVVNDEVILNEINFRNSGDVYMGIAQKYYYPFAWTEDYIGHRAGIAQNPSSADYTMTECADFRNVLVHEVSFFKWVKQFFMCKDYALWSFKDIRPAITRYFYYVRQMLHGKRL